MKMQDLKKFDKRTNENRKATLVIREKQLEKRGKDIMGLRVHASLGDGQANKVRKEISVLKKRIY